VERIVQASGIARNGVQPFQRTKNRQERRERQGMQQCAAFLGVLGVLGGLFRYVFAK
jgi:hypothetical protein